MKQSDWPDYEMPGEYSPGFYIERYLRIRLRVKEEE